MTDHPINTAIVNATAVSKAAVRSFEIDSNRLRVPSADYVRARDLSDTFGIDLNGYAYDRDTADTTSVDDGITIIVDLVGTRFVRIDTTALAPAQREITAAGAVTVTTVDRILWINKTVGAATIVNLPAAATRNGLDLVIKDKKGDANAHNITVTPNGVETIDAGATDVIDMNYGGRRYVPLAAGGWLISP